MYRKLDVADFLGKDLCLAHDDAVKLHAEIASIISADGTIELNFDRVRRTITAFLNVAIGQLYGEFKSTEIEEKLVVVGASPQIKRQYTAVIENAKLFFRDSTKFEDVRRRVYDE